jgi:hypothetical protein
LITCEQGEVFRHPDGAGLLQRVRL